MAGVTTFADGYVRLSVRLTPNARDERIDGIRTLADGRMVLAVRVRAMPEDGKANAALEALLARAVGVAKSRVLVESGASQRLKTVRIEGDRANILAGLGLDAGSAGT